MRGEIRNALSDVLGHGVKPLIRTVALDPGASDPADHAGTYRLDTGVPMDLRGELADRFEFDALDVKRTEGSFTVGPAGEPEEFSPLLPLTPVRFLASRYDVELRFHRDAHGIVRALSVETPTARAYYRRQAATQAP